MRALVLGAAGQLGRELVGLLGAESGLTHRQVSITDRDAVEAVFAARRPDIVFNCAAYNEVDRAETEPDVAMRVNGEGPAVLAAACARHGAKLLHYSTNFVFDGEKGRPYRESDEPNPLSAYARSKLAGEVAALEANPDALVVRTAAVYGTIGVGFPEKILARARRDGRLRVVTDRVNPTYARDLAERSLELAEAGLAGLVHVAGGGCCGWDEFAAEVLAVSGLPVPISSITSAELGLPARRPVNGCLDSDRVPGLRPWREALRDWAGRLANP